MEEKSMSAEGEAFFIPVSVDLSLIMERSYDADGQT